MATYGVGVNFYHITQTTSIPGSAYTTLYTCPENTYAAVRMWKTTSSVGAQMRIKRNVGVNPASDANYEMFTLPAEKVLTTGGLFVFNHDSLFYGVELTSTETTMLYPGDTIELLTSAATTNTLYLTEYR